MPCLLFVVCSPLMRALRCGLWLFVALCVAAPVAVAGPQPSGAKNTPTPKVKSKQKARKAKKQDPNRLEWGILPAIAGDTDTGVGFGVICNLAKFAPGYYPYRWRLEFLVYMTAKEAPDGGVELPYHDYYAILDLPGLAGGKLRLDGKIFFGRFTTSGYYGLGNATVNDPPSRKGRFENFKILGKDELAKLSAAERANYEELLPEYILARRYYQYDRINPGIRINARYQLPHKLFLFFGGEFLFNWINVYPGSKLEQDLRRSKDPNDDSAEALALRELLYGVEHHASLTFKLGIVYDSRNHEFAPIKGMFHDLSIRFAPGAVRYPFGGVTLHTRFYFPIYKEYLSVAIRLLGDVLFGKVPFYELATFGGLTPDNATGGSRSVRGISQRRYHGKIKLLGNIELRSKFIFFNIGSARFSIGLVAFFDAARVFADFTPRPELDGTDAGLKMGTGGGLRIQWGDSFIIRADFGYTFTETDASKEGRANGLPYTGSDFGIYIGVAQAF